MSNHQTAQVFRQMLALRLILEQVAKAVHRFANDGWKLHDAWHNLTLLFLVRHAILTEFLALLLENTNVKTRFAKLQFDL